MRTKSMATCWARLRTARGISTVRALLRRRNNSSRTGNQLSRAWRTVSREGAVARQRQAAARVQSRAQAAKITWQRIRAVQAGGEVRQPRGKGGRLEGGLGTP